MVGIYSFPVKKRKSFGNLSVAVKLIIFNVIIYFFGLILLNFKGEEFLMSSFALTPSLVLSGQNLWTLLTSMFFHVSFFHIFANMFSLFFVGKFLERIIGKKRFFRIYIFSGLFGNLLFILWALVGGGISIPGLGASGAIFGLLGVLAVLVPYSKIYLIAGPLIVLLVEYVFVPFLPVNISSVISPIFTLIIFAMFFAMFSWNKNFRKFAIPIELKMWVLPFVAIVPLIIIEFILRSEGIFFPISNSAHLGGLIAGLIYGFYLRKKYKQKTRLLNRQFS